MRHEHLKLGHRDVGLRVHHLHIGFEVLVAISYAAFADAPVDVAVVEVGLGGSGVA